MRTFTFAVLLLMASSAWAEERRVTLAVEYMTCALCPIAVWMAIKRVAGVKDVKVGLADRTAVVVFDDAQTTVEEVAAASLRAGFPATHKE